MCYGLSVCEFISLEFFQHMQNMRELNNWTASNCTSSIATITAHYMKIEKRKKKLHIARSHHPYAKCSSACFCLLRDEWVHAPELGFREAAVVSSRRIPRGRSGSPWARCRPASTWWRTRRSPSRWSSAGSSPRSTCRRWRPARTTQRASRRGGGQPLRSSSPPSRIRVFWVLDLRRKRKHKGLGRKIIM